MKINLLVICAHPDDAELSCGATLIKHQELGYTTGVIDLTEGELGTRGSRQIRKLEAQKASEIMKLSIRENLGLRDGWFQIDEENKLRIIQKIRKYQPDIIITNAPDDRHPDHSRAGQLVKEAAWLSGLAKIDTKDELGKDQIHWRPKHVFHFIQYKPLVPDLVVDIKGYFNKKMEAIMAYNSQFYDPESHEPQTLIASPEFIQLIKAKIYEAASYALIEEGEGFISAWKPAISDLMTLK
jgi:bacillithiol biosynthesis deacetylase BshB1